MKPILITLACALVLIGCSKSVHEAHYVGKWTQVKAEGVPKMTATITKRNDSYQVEIAFPAPNHAPVDIKKTGKLEDGVLKVDGIENIRFDKDNGHLMIGVNEFEPAH